MLRAALPPDDTLPPGMQQDLRVLESLSDDVLWAVARSKMAAANLILKERGQRIPELEQLRKQR